MKKLKLNSKVIIIAIIIVVIALAMFIFFTFFTRNAKSTVKEFIKAKDSGSQQKLMDLIDYKGYIALSSARSFKNNEITYDFTKFKEELNKLESQDVSDLQKKAIETMASFAVDKDDLYNYKIKKINSVEEANCKGVSKVTADIERETKNSGEKKTESLVFYTLKRGLKNYIISFD